MSKYFIFCVLFLLSACQKDSDKNPSKILISGTENIGGTFKAVFWNNGSKTILSNIASEAYSIYASGSDVYIAGSEIILGKYYPVIWKNGSKTQLSTNVGIATSVFVNGNDVFVSGTEDVYTSKPVAVFWKNGIKTQLSSKKSGSSSVFVNSSGVYIVGTDDDRACLWKDGTKIVLNAGVNSVAYDIAMLGSDYYIIGFDMISNKTYPMMWKNSTITTQLGTVDWGHANNIEISNSNIYVTGSDGGPCYWKNGLKTQLTNTSNTNAAGISIFGTDIYVSGQENDKACYWKNGTSVSLSGLSSVATSIIVQ